LLPGLTQLRSKSYLAQLYRGWHLSARQIVRLTKTHRSVVLTDLRKCGIPKNDINRLVRNQAGQSVIRLIPNKDGGTWQANTVRLILARA